MDKGNMDTTLITVGTTAPIWVQVLNNTASTILLFLSLMFMIMRMLVYYDLNFRSKRRNKRKRETK